MEVQFDGEGHFIMGDDGGRNAEMAYEALADVAKFLGFRPDSERDATDKYLLAQQRDPEGLRARAHAYVRGDRSGHPVNWKPTLLEGG